MEEKELTPEEWQDVRDEADFIYTYKGWDYRSAFNEAIKRVRKAVGKEKK